MKLSSAPPILKHDAPPLPPVWTMLNKLHFSSMKASLSDVCLSHNVNKYIFPRNFPTRNTFLSIPFYENFFDQKNFVELFFGKKLFFWANSWAKELFWILFLALFWELFILNTFWRAFLSTFLSVLVWLENHIFGKPFFE